MELTGEHRIPAPRQRVWEALHDPEILKECITGCESLEMADDGSMKARVTAKVGPVKATFDADVEIVNSNPPQSYTLQGSGKGGVAGFAKGSSDVSLTEEGDETLLSYHAKATVGGKLAQLGSRLVDSTAKRYASDFFSKFSEKVGGGAPAEPAAEPAGETPPAADVVPAPAVEVEPERSVPPVPPDPVATAAAPAAGAISGTSTPPSANNRLWLWIGLGVVVLILLYWLLD